MTFSIICKIQRVHKLIFQNKNKHKCRQIRHLYQHFSWQNNSTLLYKMHTQYSHLLPDLRQTCPLLFRHFSYILRQLLFWRELYTYVLDVNKSQ